MKSLIKEDLVKGREYLVSLKTGEVRLLYYFKKDEFFESNDEYSVCSLSDINTISKSPNYDKKLLINGSYGDLVELYLDGYISTKSGDLKKIKSVNIEEGIIECYGKGKDSYDYSRVSYSMSNDEDSLKTYINDLKYHIERFGIRVGSKIQYNDSEECSIIEIIEPDGINNYLPTIVLSNKETITFYSDYVEDKKIKVNYTPYTKEEEISNLIDKHSNSSYKLNKETFIKELFEYFNK